MHICRNAEGVYGQRREPLI